MLRAIVAAFTIGFVLLLAGFASANDLDCGCSEAGYAQRCRGGLFGWRSYSAEERRNFPNCYGGYERYYGGFHATYFRDFPGNDDGLNNHRDGWGGGWAW